MPLPAKSPWKRARPIDLDSTRSDWARDLDVDKNLFYLSHLTRWLLGRDWNRRKTDKQPQSDSSPAVGQSAENAGSAPTAAWAAQPLDQQVSWL
jgi:hypothetical protein